MITDQMSIESTYISGIAIDKDISRVAIVGIEDIPGMAYRIFNLLAKEKISVDIILQSIGRNKTKDISFTVKKGDLQRTVELLETNKEHLACDHISHDSTIAKLSIVGAGMASNPGVAAAMFEALYEIGVNINMITTSEMKLSVLLPETEVETAANAVHSKFLEQNINI